MDIGSENMDKAMETDKSINLDDQTQLHEVQTPYYSKSEITVCEC